MSRVYLVDDHIIMRECLRIMLEAAGHSVVGEAAEPTEALADLLRLRPDVLLLDVHLGPRCGFELLAELHRRELPTRCVIVSSSRQPQQVAQARRLGAVGYVLKDSAGSEFLRAIDTVAQGKIYLDAAVALSPVLHQPENEAPLSGLSPRERQIITMVVNGRSSSEIGLILHLSPKTVSTYRARLMLKLGVSDVPSLVRLAIRCKLIDSEDE